MADYESISGDFDPDDPEMLKAQRRLLIDAWQARDELYNELFGKPSYVSPASYQVPQEESPKPQSRSTSVDTADPGDPASEEQHLAVLAYGPDPLRPHWTYVTAGLCTPWLQHEPAEVSGFGCELMIKTPVDAKWPAQILRSIAYYVFNHAGTISPGARIGLGAPITVNTDSHLHNLFVWYADEAPDCWYQLPSGGFGIFCAVGITEDECRYAESIEEYGTWVIQEVLRQVGLGQISDPERESIMNRPNIESILNNTKLYADNFRNGFQ